MDFTLDWSLVQAFLAVAEEGSLSGAGRRLSVSQPTIGRQVQALEAQLGVTLFERRPRGMALTDAGAELLPAAREMLAAAGRLSLTAAGRDAGLAGTMRLSVSTFNAHHHMPRIIAALRAEAPEIEVELVATDATDNLLFREADLAMRMYRPTQLDTVAKHIGDLGLGLYASTEYLARRAPPERFEDLRDHTLVGYDRSELMIRGFTAFGLPVTRRDFAVRCDEQSVNWELVRAGCGIGVAQTAVAERDPAVRRLLPDLPLPGLPVWLAAHETLRRTPRVARVWRALEVGLAPILLPPGTVSPLP